MMSQKVCEDAFDLIRHAAMKVKEGSDMWFQFLGMAAVLGWVLQRENYLSNTEEILRAIRETVKNPVSVEMN